MGLPYEGIPKARLGRMKPNLDRQSLLFGRGMVSDDTEHTLMVAQALAASGSDEAVFARHLAHSLRLWMLAVPPGTGMATARACGRLFAGRGAATSGVWSAGNGPAMRSAIIGACYKGAEMTALVRVSTRITHTDPKAEFGALAVSLAAHFAATGTGGEGFARRFCSDLANLCGDSGVAAELLALVGKAAVSAESGGLQRTLRRVSGANGVSAAISTPRLP